MRVLLIDANKASANRLELALRSEGLNVYTTDLGEEALALGKLYDYELILLALNLPDMSGLKLLRSFRMSKVDTPIIVLSDTYEVDKKIRALRAGADDYMAKPLHQDELIASIHAIIRRSNGHSQSSITTGVITLNLDDKTVVVSGQRINLTGKEYQMLEYLSLRKGSTLTKEGILNQLYGGRDEPHLKIIDVFICKLRKKLVAATGGMHYIETVWGRGYVLRETLHKQLLAQ